MNGPTCSESNLTLQKVTAKGVLRGGGGENMITQLLNGPRIQKILFEQPACRQDYQLCTLTSYCQGIMILKVRVWLPVEIKRIIDYLQSEFVLFTDEIVLTTMKYI